MTWVIGKRRVPDPPARTMPFNVRAVRDIAATGETLDSGCYAVTIY
jgi:hypothetical protein